jgi:hypothetical protein
MGKVDKMLVLVVSGCQYPPNPQAGGPTSVGYLLLLI